MPLFPGWENFYSVFEEGEHLKMVDGATLRLWANLDIGGFLSSPSLWLGLVVCGLFTTAAIYVRRYRDES